MGRSSSGFRPSGRMRRKIHQMPYPSLRPYRRTKAHMSLSLGAADFRARKSLGICELRRHAYLRNYSPPLVRRDPRLSKMIPADARAGTTVGKYKLHEIVGRGGMGVVYRAEHVYIGKEVAV